MALMRKLDLTSCVIVAEDVPHSKLAEYYQAADVLLAPLHGPEGQPLILIEAMACGCPVICSTRGSLGEVVGNAAAIVDPQDVNSIANQLRLLASDAKMREHFRLAGFARAKQFDWNRTAHETLSLYESVTQKGEKNLSARQS